MMLNGLEIHLALKGPDLLFGADCGCINASYRIKTQDEKYGTGKNREAVLQAKSVALYTGAKAFTGLSHHFSKRVMSMQEVTLQGRIKDHLLMIHGRVRFMPWPGGKNSKHLGLFFLPLADHLDAFRLLVY